MRVIQSNLAKSAVDLLRKSEDSFDVAKMQRKAADTQHEIAARQHANADKQIEIADEQRANAEQQNENAELQHDNADRQNDSADRLDESADKLDALRHALTADAVEVSGAAELIGIRDRPLKLKAPSPLARPSLQTPKH